MRPIVIALFVLALAPAAQAAVDWSGRTLPPGVTRSTLTVGDLHTRVLQAGDPNSREAVVFIHGHPGSSDDWAHLVAVAGQYGRAVALDMVGFGDASKPAKYDYTPDGEAKFLDAALAALRIDRVHLVLHDFGGPFGLEWAKAHPDELLSVVLFDTGVFENYYGHPYAYLWVLPTGETIMDAQTRQSFGAGMQSLSVRPLPQDFVDDAWSHYDKATRAAWLQEYRSYATPLSPDAQGRAEAAVLRKKTRPALVIWGAADWALPLYVAYEQQDAFPGAQVDVLPSGHWPYVELVDQVDALVEPFWKQNVHVVDWPKPQAARPKPHKRKRCATGRRAGPGRSARTCRRPG